MDMDGVRDLIQRLELAPGQHLLDLGCGAGGIAEYIAEQTGARVTGIDYAAAAIEVANERTAAKRQLIDFIEADLNRLELPARSYDAAVMIDSIYWVADTVDGLGRILKALKPGGQLIIVIVHILDYCDDPNELDIDKNFVARALDELMLNYSAYDTTPQFLPFWPRTKQALEELHDEFVAEGNEFIYNSLWTEATDEYLPAIEAGDIRRYLYHVRV